MSIRQDSFRTFLDLVVQENDPILYDFIINAPRDQYVDKNGILTRFALIIFAKKEAGKTTDYVRELVSAYLEGALIWVP